MTYIHEFPHPRMAVLWHPTSKQFTLDDLQYALLHGVRSVEVDVHLRPSDGRVVCNHDRPTEDSPVLEQVIERVLTHKGASRTVHNDGLQFLLVLEPKANSPRLFDGIASVLDRYARHFSTSVPQSGSPRGITVVITGSYPREFHAHFAQERVNRLCVAETHDYTGEITNLAADGTGFQWASLRYADGIRARVAALHNGTDPSIPGRFNVRIWDGHKNMDKALASGADAVNADKDEIGALEVLIAARRD